MSAQTQSFCYIESDKLTYISNTGVNAQVAFQDAVADLEVLSKEKLIALIDQFVQMNGLTPSSIIFILAATVTFDQDLSTVAVADLDNISQRFIDTVPFENVAQKRIPMNGKVLISAANKEFFTTIKGAFEKRGFQVTAIVPFTFLQAAYSELANSLDPNVIFGKFDSLKQYTLEHPEIVHPASQQQVEKSFKLKGGRDMALVGIFAVLMLVLGYMVLANFVFVAKPSTPDVKGPNTSGVSQNKPLVFPTTTQKPATPSSQLKQ